MQNRQQEDGIHMANTEMSVDGSVMLFRGMGFISAPLMQTSMLAIMPLTAFFAGLSAAFYTYKAYRERTGHSIAKMALEILAAGGIIAAAAVGSVVSLSLGMAIFGGVFVAKGLFDFGSAIYYGVKAAQSSDPVMKRKYSDMAKENVASGVINTLCGAGFTVLTVFGGPIVSVAVAVAGVLTTMVGALVYFVSRKFRDDRERSERKNEKREQTQSQLELDQSNKPAPSVNNTKGVYQILGFDAAPQAEPKSTLQAGAPLIDFAVQAPIVQPAEITYGNSLYPKAGNKPAANSGDSEKLSQGFQKK